MAEAKLTKLRAVNRMLNAIGEAPVNSLSTGSTADVISAESILDDVSLDVQTLGWWFNTEYNYPLPADINDNILLPSNILSVDSISPSYLDCVERDGKLYSRYNRTSTITDTVYVDMTLLFEFANLPEAAKRYITIRAARMFVEGVLKDVNIRGFTQQDELTALAALQDAEGTNADHTIFNNYDTYRIIGREASEF